MKSIFLAALAALVLTGCGKTATITVDPGMGNGVSPAVDCHAVIPNPDYHPTTGATKP